MKNDPKELCKLFLEGNIPALARVISLVEDDSPLAADCLRTLFPRSGNARIIGITGPPGAGKSTLVDCLAQNLVESGKKVAILAVDPSSPFTGGAVLGDRIRMTKAFQDSGVYIRSMASRGALGGLAPRTTEAIFILDAFGFDTILIETVGVGQAEVDIVKLVDSVALVLVPGMGDTVQALKAGIMEIADIFVVNKADHPGADRLEKELHTLLSLVANPEWNVPILRTIATKNEGVDKLASGLEGHRDWAKKSGQAEKRRSLFLEESFKRELVRMLSAEVLEKAKRSGAYAEALEKLHAREQDPRSQARAVLDSFS